MQVLVNFDFGQNHFFSLVFIECVLVDSAIKEGEYFSLKFADTGMP